MNTPRRALLALFGTGVLGLVVPTGAAFAGHGHGHNEHTTVVVNVAPQQATLEIDNRFDGPVEVWIDGRSVGSTAGDSRRAFQAHVGNHSVVLKRANTGFVLRSERVSLRRASSTRLVVNPPLTTLRVSNPSRTPLRVTACESNVWLSPGQVVDLPVESGNVQLVAFARGDERVHGRTVWVEPGRLVSTSLDYTEPTRFVVYNQHPHSVRVLVDGTEVERIGPGSQAWVDTRPGTRLVQVFHGSRLIQTESLRLERGQSKSLILRDAVTRPGPPPRVTYDDNVCPITGRPLSVASR